ncbi:unnamed protein product, partial [Phaeothamnion confervicola]
LRWSALSEARTRVADPLHGGSTQLFPASHYYPLYSQRLVGVEISCNSQDFTDTGVAFLYQADARVTAVYAAPTGPNAGGAAGAAAAVAAGTGAGGGAGTVLFVLGDNFVNSTSLVCRVGARVLPATFLGRELLMCRAPATPAGAGGAVENEEWGLWYGEPGAASRELGPRPEEAHRPAVRVGPRPGVLFVEVSNNGADFTADSQTFQVPGLCPSGSFCPAGAAGPVGPLACPQGAFCPGEGNANFTLCPPGTYQPQTAQSSCLRCPIGFHCPEFGLPAPRVCPAGRVCDVTGAAAADQPCPEGHFCLEGTATTATTCGHPQPSSRLFPALVHAVMPSTIGLGAPPSLYPELVLGARRTACWSNATDDFGLMVSGLPTRFWQERGELPLGTESAFVPLRGRYCLDDACLRLADAEDFRAADAVFDYSGFALRRPVPCPPNTYCRPGTAVGDAAVANYSAPQPCLESMYCPEGSAGPAGAGACPVGFHCPFGARMPCPVGTYCPRAGLWDPLACPPGTFNPMVAQERCTSCPRGYICPGFGRLAPAICPAGMVCSRGGLMSPNLRCAPGFYCPAGTVTSDPFRNDTTARPYPCTPGTYCPGGVGYAEVLVDNFLYAQACPAGFYCEAASTSPRGSGLCPPGFYCPEKTAVPIPTPPGYFADLEGTVDPSKCLPGYYAPTIESTECYPCPPGTTCEEDGMFIADICPPGTYRSTLEQDGLPCAGCPQGTWSKNWELTEPGECQRCPAGVVCASESMTRPCSRSDLPTPFEPVVSADGSAAAEYSYAIYNRPGYFSSYECLRLNDGYADGTMEAASQVYFFGEVVPPYIDALGRGPHFRSTDDADLLYQTTAKCYRNTQRLGSKIYQRIRDYYGPQFDIQTGAPHQGYGDANDYGGFFGKGSRYIDLPKARVFDASYNCTPGFAMLREDGTAPSSGASIVYTDPDHDPAGSQRALYMPDDTWYPGTCEADVICDEDGEAEAVPCPEGYVCDEMTTSESSTYYSCREGYVCDFGTTPDPNIEAPEGQFTKLCPLGYVCSDGTGLGQAERELCPANYFCPTGTADPLAGQMADDAVNRGISATDANPFLDEAHVGYFGDDDVRIVSLHDLRCFVGIDDSERQRFYTRWLSEGDPPADVTIAYMREARPGLQPYVNRSDYRPGMFGSSPYVLPPPSDGAYYRPSVVSMATAADARCARDHKWRLVVAAIDRNECNCVNQVYVIAAVYRLWKCTGSTLDDLGIAALHATYYGGRDFWFSRKAWSGSICDFSSEADRGFNLTAGTIPYDSSWPAVHDENDGTLSLNYSGWDGLRVQFTWLQARSYTTYTALKTEVETEYATEATALAAGTRTALDPFVYDLYTAVRHVEEYGERLPDLVWLAAEASGGGSSSSAADAATLSPGRYDMCECERLLKCPNGTASAVGSGNIYDCEATGNEVLRRVNAVPPRYMTSTNNTHIGNGTDFTELTGDDAGVLMLGSLLLDSLEVATVTLDLSSLVNNATYGKHYQLAVYVDCKPCPARYVCDYATGDATAMPTCTSPSADYQQELYDACLQTYSIPTCYDANAEIVDCSSAAAVDGFDMPDWYKCRDIPFFCDDKDWPEVEWDWVYDSSGAVANGATQEASGGLVDAAVSADGSVLVERSTTGCCQCERHSLPAFFADDTEDFGYPDNKHNLVQVDLSAIRGVEVTIALELLHGSYYRDFDDIVPEAGELFIFTPARSRYRPTTASRASFMFVIQDTDYDDLVLPLNLPAQWVRVAGEASTSTTKTFENAVFVDRLIASFVKADSYHSRPPLPFSLLVVPVPHRSYEIAVADPTYYTRVARQAAITALAEGHNATVTDYSSLDDRYAVAETLSDVTAESGWWTTGDSSGTNEFLAMPYLPFISSCGAYGRHVSFSRLVETHPECTLVPYEQTRPTNMWTSVGKTPFADSCDVELTAAERYDDSGNLVTSDTTRGAYLECNYEEDVEKAAAKLRWYESSVETLLFHATRDPIEPADFEDSDTNGDGVADERWGRTTYLDGERANAIPVDVSDSNGGMQSAIPRHVKLTIEYYQRTRGKKRLVYASLDFTELCTTIKPVEYGGSATKLATFAKKGVSPCEVDILGDIKSTAYTLEVQYYALSWWQLLNAFEFSYMVYVILFIIVGLIAATEATAVWGMNRLLTRLRHPPPFHSYTLLRMTAEAPTQGALLAIVPCLLTVLFVWLWFGEEGPCASSDPAS